MIESVRADAGVLADRISQPVGDEKYVTIDLVFPDAAPAGHEFQLDPHVPSLRQAGRMRNAGS
jgi:hypothetical protein